MKAEYAQQLPPGWERFSRFFFALGDRTRQQILLVFEPNEEICVNDVARLFQLSRPAISHHLKVLRDAGLLISEKRGKEVYYRVNFAHCADVLRIVHDAVRARLEEPAHPPRYAYRPGESQPSWPQGDTPSVSFLSLSKADE